MTAKQYLNQIRLLDIKINHRIKQAEEIRAKAFIISGIDTTKDRIQTSQSAAVGLKYIDKYVDIMHDVNRMIDEYIDLKHKIISEIDSLEDERYIEVLYCRYVEGMYFNDIAMKMGYTKDYTWRLHRDALRDFEKIKDNSKCLLSNTNT